MGLYEDGQVCFPATASQDTVLCLTIRAIDECGAMTSDEICISVHYNLPPMVELSADTSIVVCEVPENFCFSYTVSDPDSPTPTVELIDGVGTVSENQVCIQTDTVGLYCISIQATDDCGATSIDDACLVIAENTPPVLTVADDFSVELCFPEEICFDTVSYTHLTLPTN